MGKSIAFGVAETISSLKSMSIHLSKENYKSIFDNSAVAITVCDEQERLVLWNKFAENLLGLTYQQLYLKPVRDLYPEAEWQSIKSENIRQKGIDYHFETKLITGNQKLIDVDLSISILKEKDGSIRGSIGIIRDITERKIAELALKASEEFSATLRNNSPNPMMILNPDSSISYVNPALEKFIGYSAAELNGRETSLSLVDNRGSSAS